MYFSIRVIYEKLIYDDTKIKGKIYCTSTLHYDDFENIIYITFYRNRTYYRIIIVKTFV